MRDCQATVWTRTTTNLLCFPFCLVYVVDWFLNECVRNCHWDWVTGHVVVLPDLVTEIGHE
jgi:hypothetical protein